MHFNLLSYKSLNYLDFLIQVPEKKNPVFYITELLIFLDSVLLLTDISFCLCGHDLALHAHGTHVIPRVQDNYIYCFLFLRIVIYNYIRCESRGRQLYRFAREIRDCSILLVTLQIDFVAKLRYFL